jgi:hypothetical protein
VPIGCPHDPDTLGRSLLLRGESPFDRIGVARKEQLPEFPGCALDDPGRHRPSSSRLHGGLDLDTGSDASKTIAGDSRCGGLIAGAQFRPGKLVQTRRSRHEGGCDDEDKDDRDTSSPHRAPLIEWVRSLYE